MTVSAVPYQVGLVAEPAIVASGSTTRLVAAVSPAAAGTVKFYAGASLIATRSIVAGAQATFNPVVPMGTTLYHADFIPAPGALVAGTSSVVAVVGKQGTTVSIGANLASVVSGEGLVTFTAATGAWDATGSVSFWDVTGIPTNLGTAPLVSDDYSDSTAVLQARLYGAGVHAIEARYGGDATYAPATSFAVGVDVAADTGVRASGVGVQYATFYPYKDSYGDTVVLRGTPGEPLESLSVKIYNSAGRLIRSWAYGSRTSAWAVPWNGKTASGASLPAGRYKVVQRLTDVPGHVSTISSYTTSSSKRLYCATGSITKFGSKYSTWNTSAFGWVMPSYRYPRGVNVYGNIYDSWAWVGYRFTLPSAVQYGTLTFSIIGSPQSGRGVPYISLWNYGSGSEDATRWVGRSYTWYSTSASGTGRVSASHHVRAFVTAEGWNEGWYDVASVRLTYRYAVLR